MTYQTIRVLEQAVGIAKQRIENLEEENVNLMRNLELRRDLYSELEKSEEFWRGECASEERKTSTAITLLVFVCVLAAYSIVINIFVC